MPNNTSKKLNAAQKTHAIYLYALLSAYSKRMQLFVSNKPAFVGNYLGSRRSATITIIVKTQGHFSPEKVAAWAPPNYSHILKNKNDTLST